MVNFSTRIPRFGSHGPALLGSFIFSDVSICSKMAFSPLEKSDPVVPLTFRQNKKGDAPFHSMPYGYFHADWDSLRDHIRDVPWEDIFEFGASGLLVNFVSKFMLELTYISSIENIR